MAAPLELISEPEDVRLALSPMRRRLLARLQEPSSATQIAAVLGLPRQRVNYHLRELERAGLIELVEERKRRGFVERVLVARARGFLVDPDLMEGDAEDRGGARRPDPRRQDRFAADRLVATAADTVRQVTRMRAAAEGEGSRLLTFTIETEVGFRTPADLERFTTALADQVATTVAAFDSPGGRRYRVVAGGHPAPAPPDEDPPTEEGRQA